MLGALIEVGAMNGRGLWVTLTMLGALLPAGPAVAARWGTESSAVAQECPVIVAGKIVRIDEAVAERQEKHGSAEPIQRLLDVAHIRISAVHKCLIRGIKPAVGGEIPARMHSRKNKTWIEHDLHYEVGTEGVWMLYLGDDGHFCINCWPEQKQDLHWAPPRERVGVMVRRPDAPPDDDPGIYTAEEWITARREKRHPLPEEQKAANARIAALAARCKDAVAKLRSADRLEPDRLPSLLELPDDLRSGLLNKTANEMDISPEDWTTIRMYLARKDPIENHRSRAVSNLGGKDAYPRSRGLLLESLRDNSPRIRLFACQSLMFTRDKTTAGNVAALLDDPDAEVRRVAVRALGWLGGKEHIPAVVAAYRREPEEGRCAWPYADALARLGEKDVSLSAVRAAMRSDNWNVRYYTTEVVAFIDSPVVVPALMDLLVGELARTVGDMKAHHIGDRVYIGLYTELQKRTDQAFGDDAVKWLGWWNDTGRTGSGAAAVEFDRQATQQLLGEYRRLKSGGQKGP